MKITTVTEVPFYMPVLVGSRLLIPCRFHLDDPSQGHLIRMEWGRAIPEKDSYQPLLIHYNHSISEHFDRRVRAFNRLVNAGNCSLVIDPARLEDYGQYELHLSLDGIGQEYEPTPMVQVNTFREQGKLWKWKN